MKFSKKNHEDHNKIRNVANKTSIGLYPFLFLATIFLLTINCKNKSAMEQNVPKDFGKKYSAAWSGQDAEAHAKFFSPNGTQIVNDGTPAVGHEAISEVAQGFMTAFPDMLDVCDSLPITSKGVEYHWTLTGTNSGPNGTGNKVHISGVEILQFDTNRLITESNGSFDAEEYNRQIKYGVEE